MTSVSGWLTRQRATGAAGRVRQRTVKHLPKRRRLGNREVWAAPVALASLTCIGLIAALLADGFGDWLSWLTLGIPVATVAWFLAGAGASDRS